MISVLLIEKNGTVREQKIKSFDKNDFYKKCGFKKPDKFEQRTVWKKMKVGGDLVNLTLYAKKTDGLASTSTICRHRWTQSCILAQCSLQAKTQSLINHIR